jgi:hypothetical protein
MPSRQEATRLGDCWNGLPRRQTTTLGGHAQTGRGAAAFSITNETRAITRLRVFIWTGRDLPAPIEVLTSARRAKGYPVLGVPIDPLERLGPVGRTRRTNHLAGPRRSYPQRRMIPDAPVRSRSERGCSTAPPEVHPGPGVMPPIGDESALRAGITPDHAAHGIQYSCMEHHDDGRHIWRSRGPRVFGAGRGDLDPAMHLDDPEWITKRRMEPNRMFRGLYLCGNGGD